jgi:hypothetical protein
LNTNITFIFLSHFCPTTNGQIEHVKRAELPLPMHMYSRFRKAPDGMIRHCKRTTEHQVNLAKSRETTGGSIFNDNIK